jgi:hypothetical protein
MKTKTITNALKLAVPTILALLAYPAYDAKYHEGSSLYLNLFWIFLFGYITYRIFLPRQATQKIRDVIIGLSALFATTYGAMQAASDITARRTYLIIIVIINIALFIILHPGRPLRDTPHGGVNRPPKAKK